MEYTLTVKGSSLEEIQEVFSALSGKQRKPMVIGEQLALKLEPKNESVPEQEVIGNDAGDVTIEMLRPIVQAQAKAGKREEVKKLLKSYKADSLTELDASNYSSFKAKLEAL